MLGLDYLYRDAMKSHEVGELLPCARRVAQALEVLPGDVPVEGYYTESPELTEYFCLAKCSRVIKTESGIPAGIWSLVRRCLISDIWKTNR